MAGSVSVRIDGLAQVRSALKRAEQLEEVAELEAVMARAAEIVADDARSRVPKVTGLARSAIRSDASALRAYVIGDKRTARYYGWLDFGSRNPQTRESHVTPVRGRRSRAKWGPWKRSGFGPRDGRFIYPAIDDNLERVADMVASGVDRVMGKYMRR